MIDHDRARGLFLLRVTTVLLGVLYLHVTLWPTGHGAVIFCLQLALLAVEAFIGVRGTRAAWRSYRRDLGHPVEQTPFEKLKMDMIRRFGDWPPG